MPDGAEILFGTNPIIADATADPDGDGLTNAEEIALGSAPTTPAAPATAGALKLRLFLPR